MTVIVLGAVLLCLTGVSAVAAERAQPDRVTTPTSDNALPQGDVDGPSGVIEFGATVPISTPESTPATSCTTLEGPCFTLVFCIECGPTPLGPELCEPVLLEVLTCL